MTQGSYHPLNALSGPDPGMNAHLILTRALQHRYVPAFTEGQNEVQRDVDLAKLAQLVSGPSGN